ncbi:MAG: hypothetical protein Q9M76_04950 [Candidatus Dojkabacteria bacterium]|nr:hypothetical protein [Candidatus Dojkabacteria bacterium]
MELALVATCSEERPLLVLEPLYGNYLAFAKRLGIRIESIPLNLNNDSIFDLPTLKEIEDKIKEVNPGAL